ncbi:MAG: hypothetical protein IPM52_06220 [Bacteroidetes bacterium]|nr:hypothetical protein [Bacteroidota bacterium]
MMLFVQFQAAKIGIFRMNPDKMAKLTGIPEIRKDLTKQKAGIFYLLA